MAGTPWTSSRVQTTLSADGVTVNVPALIAYLRAWAHEHGTGAADLGEPFPGSSVSEMLEETARLIRRDAGLRGVGRWLTALAATPGQTEFDRLLRMLTVASPAALAERVRWFDLGDAGPYAWAAGMPCAEARARRDEGTLDVEGLAMLAGLRGWLFAPPLG